MTVRSFILLGLCFLGNGGDPHNSLPHDYYEVTEIRTKKTTRYRTVEKHKKVTKRSTANQSKILPL